MTNDELLALRAENETLRRQLKVATNWMERQWREETHKISKRRTNRMTESDKAEFLRENLEEVSFRRVHDFFGDLLLMNAPKDTVPHLVDAEITFFNLRRMNSGDGLSVISSYTKLLDGLVEGYVTSQFRKYATKRGAVVLRVNDPLEKALHLVITKKYILSIGRLYALLKSIRGDEKLHGFGTTFREYLEKYATLGNFLLSDEFFVPFAKLVESDVFGSKRHSGKITIDETVETRNVLLGDFRDRSALVYRLLENQSSAY